MRKVYYIKQTPSGRVFDAVNGIVIALLMFLMIYPFWNMLILSFNDGTDALLGKLYFWPRVWTLSNYEYVFKNRDLLHGALVSVLRVVVGTVTGVICNALLGYIVSCRQFYGRKFMRLLFIITMYFGGGLIPTYLVVNKLGLLNTRWAMIIPGACSVYNVLITRTYFMSSIPDALQEAATLDGANSYQYLVRIVLPLSKPILAVVGLYYAVGHWNDFYTALIYITNEDLLPLQSFLRDILMSNKMMLNSTSLQGMDAATAEARMQLAQTLKYSVIIVSTVPVLCIYPFIQKYFVKGVMIGSVKG